MQRRPIELRARRRACTNLAQVGTQQLGLTLCGVLIYLRHGVTARAGAEGWSAAAVLAQALRPAMAGKRPLLVGPTAVVAMVRLAGLPDVGAMVEPARARRRRWGGAASEDGAGHVENCDATAYPSMMRAWRQAARLLGDNPTEDE